MKFIIDIKIFKMRRKLNLFPVIRISELSDQLNEDQIMKIK